MVKVGDFTVELVAADTKDPFTEHTASDGQIYAEVEPDMDYYISLRTDVGGVMMKMFVDGVDLRYHYRFPGHGPNSINISKYIGSWERKDGKETMTALHFNKTRQAPGEKPDLLTGKVEVKVYALGEECHVNMNDFLSTSLNADSTLGGKKCIRSTTSGSHSFDQTLKGQTASSTIVNYKLGEHLRTITVHYCSALGLIYHKILPRPPDSDSEADDDSVPVPVKKERVPVKKETSKRAKRKRPTEASVAAAGRASSGQNKRTAQYDGEGVEMVTVQKNCALVDLTGDD